MGTLGADIFGAILSEETTDDNDRAFDEEVKDLVAVMNSAVIELEMEMQMLHKKDYETHEDVKVDTEENQNVTPAENDNVDSCSSSSSNRNGYSPPDNPTQEHELPGLNDIEDTSTASATRKELSATKKIEWQSMKPAKMGDPDYSPVLDYTKWGVATVLEPAKPSDADYVSVSDYTKQPKQPKGDRKWKFFKR